MGKYNLKEIWELTDSDHKDIYEYFIKSSDRITKGKKMIGKTGKVEQGVTINGVDIEIGTCGITANGPDYLGAIQIGGFQGLIIFLVDDGLEIYNNREQSGAVIGNPVIVKGRVR